MNSDVLKPVKKFIFMAFCGGYILELDLLLKKPFIFSITFLSLPL